MALLLSPTLSRLILEARIFLNQPQEANSFWKDNELTIYANDAIRKYFCIINENTEGQFDTSVYLDIVANQEVVPLPDDCFEVRAVYKVQPNFNVMLKYRNNLTESYVTNPTDANSGDQYAPYYYFREAGLVLRPIPTFNEVGGPTTGGLLLEYTHVPDTLIVGGDTLTSSISPVFKELVVKYMCYQAKLKESSVLGGNTYEPVASQLMELERQFKESVGGRSKYPQYVVPYSPY